MNDVTDPRQPSRPEDSPIDAVYHVDPLCGWCFAIADELDTAREALGASVRWTLKMGGLVVGERVRPVGLDAAYLRTGLDQVAQVSGRTASPEYFANIVDSGTWVSDSEPVCRAVLVTVELAGSDAGFAASRFLTDRLYVDGQEPDTSDSITELAATLDIDTVTFLDTWRSPEARQRLQDHWAATRRTGLQTYPTVAVQRGDHLHAVVTGFAPSATIVDRIRSV